MAFIVHNTLSYIFDKSRDVICHIRFSPYAVVFHERRRYLSVLTVKIRMASKTAEDTGQSLENNVSCVVCGDIASGNHYGVLSCEACKSFFGRYAISDDHFICFAGGNCKITVNTRNKCKYCRLQKCTAKGMMKEGELTGQ